MNDFPCEEVHSNKRVKLAAKHGHKQKQDAVVSQMDDPSTSANEMELGTNKASKKTRHWAEMDEDGCVMLREANKASKRKLWVHAPRPRCFRSIPDLPVLLWYVNNGWRGGELLCLIAFLQAVDQFEMQLTFDEQENDALDRLSKLYMLSVKKCVPLCRVIFDTFGVKGSEIMYGETGWGEDDFVWCATTPFEITPDVIEASASFDFDVGIDEKWAKEKVVGRNLKVPGYWWTGCSTQKKWAGKIVGFDPSDESGRCFLFVLDDDDWPDFYPMTYTDVRKFAIVDKATKALPVNPVLSESTDCDFHGLCQDTDNELSQIESSDSLSVSSSRIRLIIRKHAEARVKQLLCAQRIVPEFQMPKGDKDSDGRLGWYWGGEENSTDDNVDTLVRAKMLAWANEIRKRLSKAKNSGQKGRACVPANDPRKVWKHLPDKQKELYHLLAFKTKEEWQYAWKQTKDYIKGL